MNDTHFAFAYPEMLLLLVPVVALIAWALMRRPPSLVFSGTFLLSRVVHNRARLRARLPHLVRGLALVLCVLALARPQTYSVSQDVSSPGVDIILCMDVSGSMEALDFTLDGKPVTRLTAAKKVVSDFVKERTADRIGLVVFGSHAFTQAPLTTDEGLLLALIERLSVGMAGGETAIGDALALAGKRIKDVPAKTRLVILLTDGRQNAGKLNPAEAASALAALGIRIYTVGVGGHEPAPFVIRSIFGPRTVYQDVDLDEATLTEIASIGDGRYFHAADTGQLRAAYDEIDRMEKTRVKVKELFHYDERYLWFLLPAVLLLACEVLGLVRRALP